MIKIINLNEKTLEEIKINENNCINCKKCYNSCPMMSKYSSSPKELMKKIITDKGVDKNIPYSCSSCEVCNLKCPKDIKIKEMFYDMRKDIFNNDKKNINDIGYNSIKFHQINSFSPIFSKSFSNKSTKKLFFPGCSLASYSPEIVLKTYEYLKKNIHDLSIAFKCCGKPTLSMGDVDKFKIYYSQVENLFLENKIEEVIVACPNCFNTIKKYSKSVKVKTIWEVINENSIPKNLINHYNDLDIKFSLHDPCPIRYEPKIHDSVRLILKSLGIKIVEFDKSRENTECCGSGGMLRVTNPKLALEQTNKRASEAKTDTVISYCESCCEAMMIANKNTLHILDFMFNDNVINKSKFTQDKTSTIKKWKNRYKSIKLIKN